MSPYGKIGVIQARERMLYSRLELSMDMGGNKGEYGEVSRRGRTLPPKEDK